jgi:hypothetical protein
MVFVVTTYVATAATRPRASYLRLRHRRRQQVRPSMIVPLPVPQRRGRFTSTTAAGQTEGTRAT